MLRERDAKAIRMWLKALTRETRKASMSAGE